MILKLGFMQGRLVPSEKKKLFSLFHGIIGKRNF